MKRIVLFLATNVAILLVLSIAMRVLGLEPYLTETGLNLTSLLVMAAVMGFGGSFISLAISKWMAKKSMGVRVIETPSNSTELWLVDTIRKYAADAGIGMPEVGVYDAPDVNAFATGMTRNNSLVAVSSGLLQQMKRNEAEAVLGHEIAHVTQKHHLKVLKQSSLIGALGQAASRKAQGSDPVVQNLIGNGAEIMARGLDKNAEYEADRVGMVYAARAGYTPWGLPGVLQDMAGLPAKDSRTGLLYKTHPHPADRLAALGEAVDGRLDAVRGKEVADRFYRIR